MKAGIVNQAASPPKNRSITSPQRVRGGSRLESTLNVPSRTIGCQMIQNDRYRWTDRITGLRFYHLTGFRNRLTKRRTLDLHAFSMPRRSYYQVHHLSGNVAVLLGDDQRQVAVPLSRLPRNATEGVVLSVPLSKSGAPSWSAAKVDVAEGRRRLGQSGDHDEANEST